MCCLVYRQISKDFPMIDSYLRTVDHCTLRSFRIRHLHSYLIGPRTFLGWSEPGKQIHIKPRQNNLFFSIWISKPLRKVSEVIVSSISFSVLEKTTARRSLEESFPIARLPITQMNYLNQPKRTYWSRNDCLLEKSVINFVYFSFLFVTFAKQ